MINDTSVIGSAIQSMWGRVGPNLIRLTADFVDNTAKMEFVVYDCVSPKEEQSYQDAATEYLSYFSNDSELDVRILKTLSGVPADGENSLAVQVFLCDLGSGPVKSLALAAIS